MKSENEVEFRKATRMGTYSFKLLLNFLKERITKQDYVGESIPAESRIVLTLVYLGQGVCRQMLAWAFRVGVSTVVKIVYETCDAIWDVLMCKYLQPPNAGEWLRIANEFQEKTGMPHVLGAIDGKHVSIKSPPHSGSQYFNYKQFFSIVLLAACDSAYKFIAIDVGAYGSQSDGGILKQSTFGQQLLNGTLNPLEPAPLPNSNLVMPYYFIGDAAFPLKENFMRPYAGRSLPNDKENFNKRMSRGRVRIENSFGILCAKWRILLNKLDMLPQNAEKIIKATTIWHNFVQCHERDQYCPESYVDHYNLNGDFVEGLWRQEIQPLEPCTDSRSRNSSLNAKGIRDALKDYLMNN